MRVRGIIWSITISLVVLTIGALALSQILPSAGVVSGDHGTEQHLEIEDEDQDEIDPEACATVVEKELLGPVNVATSTVLELPESPAGEGVDVLREQMIIKVIAACNVDDEDGDPPNEERDLDIDIEIFSIICEIRDDLSVKARCEIFRVAQETNAVGADAFP